MIRGLEDGTYLVEASGEIFTDDKEASFWDMFYSYQNFIGSPFFGHDGEKVYIYNEYLYKNWLVYLSLLQCTIHPNLIKSYDYFDDNIDMDDAYLDNQSAVPLLFQKYNNDFKGPGWYWEESTFGPIQDNIGIDYELSDNCPLSYDYRHDLELIEKTGIKIGYYS